MHLGSNMQPHYGHPAAAQYGYPGQQQGYGFPQGMRTQAQSSGYEYQLPSQQYAAQPSWGAWDLANAQYGGNRLERSFFDSIISGLSGFFGSRHLSEQAAHEAHRKVYYIGEGSDSGTRTLGGAAAYQAYLIWDRDHHSAYHSFPTHENRERLVGLAVAELFNLWDRVEPRRDGRARQEEAAEYAAATAKHLFDRHYDLAGGSRRLSGRGYDGDDSDDEYERRRRHQRRSMEYGQYRPGATELAGGQQAMPPGMGIGAGMMGMGQQGMMPGMQPGMMQPGMMGQQGMYPQGMMPQQMNMGGGVGMGGMMPPQMMGHGMGMSGMGMGMGMHPGGMTMGEAQAVPGMHPYNYGPQHGVAYGNQPIDSMGNAMYPGVHRSWYAGMGGRSGGY